MTGDQTVKSV